MHAVMVALPMPGHIIPMLDLALKLASMGVKVSFVNSEFNKSKMKLPSSEQDDACPELDKLYSSMSFLHIPDGLPPEHDRRNVVELLTAVDASYGLHVGELLRNQLSVQEPPVSCIISNTFVRHVQEAADSTGLPYVSFWTQSAASFASVLMVAKGYRPSQDSQLVDLIPPSLLPGVPNVRIGDLNSFVQCYNEDDFMYRLFVAPMRQIMNTECILMNTFEELEVQTIASLCEKEHLKVLPIGPLLPQSFFDDDVDAVAQATDIWVSEDLHCLSWLDKQEKSSVIYVSFGSISSMCKEQLEEIALGLEASKKAFLWVVRPRMMDAQEVMLPEGFLERTADRGLLVAWAPQLKVLRHRAVAVFLTHCGWNSTLEGICAGVPLLCYPFVSDQPTNCRCIVDQWQVGLSLQRQGPPPGMVDREEVAKKVVELICCATREGVRANAHKWRSAARKAVSGSSYLNLQRFIDNYQNSRELTELPIYPRRQGPSILKQHVQSHSQASIL